METKTLPMSQGLKPRLLSTDLGHYVEAVWSGKNESGYEPIGDRVLVLPNVASPQTSGDVYIPDEVIENNTYSSETGILIAVGGDAFLWNSDRSREWQSLKPVPGDKIFFERFAGGIVRGIDGKMYRIMDDKMIAAVKTMDAEEHGGAVSNPTGRGESG